MTHFRFLLTLTAFAALVHGSPADPPLMPLPAKISALDLAHGVAIDSNFKLAVTGPGAADSRVSGAALRSLIRLQRQTGIPIQHSLTKGANQATVVIEVAATDHPAPQKLGDTEHYRISVSGKQAHVIADAPLGALRAIETLLQLVQPGPSGFVIPAVEIDDQPRFAWRGFMLDVSRHFIPLRDVEKTIDGIAAVKLNVFHWHLSDDQGFRIESKRFPKLQDLGSDGLYYTQEEVRGLISYARDRGVRVVPEFDMPGHTSSWFVGYPEYASGKGPYAIVHQAGTFDAAMNPTIEATYKFLDKFIGEMAALFPDEYFHIGGDELQGKEWKENASIQAFMKQHQLADMHALQSYFNTRIQTIVAKHGKHMEGWDEILDPSLPKNIVIQSWRGQKSLAEAARLGYSGILSAGYYLDLMFPASQHYAADPMKGETAGLTPEQSTLILGGEAAMWEELATPEILDVKLWPRLAAIAERLWSPEAVTDVDSMYRRLEVVSRWLEWNGLRHKIEPRLMRQRLAGAGPVYPLEIFASILEPVKEYGRTDGGQRVYMTDTPLNRLVDSIPPESDAARQFRDAVDRFLANPSNDAADAEYLEKKLTSWSKNVPEVLPILQSNGVLAETIPVANAVNELCGIGLQALAALRNGKASDPSSMAAVEEASKPKPMAELLIQISPAIRKLVEAAGRR